MRENIAIHIIKSLPIHIGHFVVDRQAIIHSSEPQGTLS